VPARFRTRRLDTAQPARRDTPCRVPAEHRRGRGDRDAPVPRLFPGRARPYRLPSRRPGVRGP
jgi:hypothetical protein